MEEEEVDALSAAGSIRSFVFPEKKIDLAMIPFLLRSPSSILSRAFGFCGGRGRRSGGCGGRRSRGCRRGRRSNRRSSNSSSSSSRRRRKCSRSSHGAGGWRRVGRSECSGKRKGGSARLVKVGNSLHLRGRIECRGRYHGHFAGWRLDAGL